MSKVVHQTLEKEQSYRMSLFYTKYKYSNIMNIMEDILRRYSSILKNI